MADLGAGAGFPGLVLKIARPDLKLHVIEQNAKKATFLSEIVRELKLNDVSVHKVAYGQLPASVSNFDIVVSRALGDYKAILRWCCDRLARPDGKVLLWIGAEEAARLSATPKWQTVKIIPISDSRQRVVFVGRPT